MIVGKQQTRAVGETKNEKAKRRTTIARGTFIVKFIGEGHDTTAYLTTRAVHLTSQICCSIECTREVQYGMYLYFLPESEVTSEFLLLVRSRVEKKQTPKPTKKKFVK